MCGIAGFIGTHPSIESDEARGETLRAMTDCLRHRGPDDRGTHLLPHAALGHRRLSIIDLETGHQPMSLPDNSATIVFNGEIYNFQEIRKELEQRGHTFRTHSDTEVLLHAYSEYGEACLDRLNGMFAFAIWDERKQRLFAARDRMGQKPFYYALREGCLLFASELKSLLRHPALRPKITPRTLARYLGFGYAPAPDTIYEDVYKLSPGHKLAFESGDLSISRYWEIDFERADLCGLSGKALQARFLDVFRDAVRLRLISDVPLGVFLSGGVDSSAVVAMMCELMPASQVKTFAIGFREKSHDESGYARLVAGHFGVDHHEKLLDEDVMLERLPSLIAGMDEPFADSSLCPTSLVSEFARSKVTVALGGDGGDELFAGYNTFHLDRLTAWYALLPRLLRKQVIERGVGLLAGACGRPGAAAYVGDAADAPAPWRLMMWSEAVAKPALMETILAVPPSAVPSPEAIYADTVEHYRRGPRRSRLARVQFQYQRQYLPDDILTKVDRASMAHSLEVRAPLMDPRVVDFANALPDRMKLRYGRGKRFFKEALRGRLPDAILDRPKKGFGIPMDDWLRSALRPAFERTCSPERIREQGLFRPEPLQRLWAEHQSGRRNHGGLLWTFLAFQLWHERHEPEFSIA